MSSDNLRAKITDMVSTEFAALSPTTAVEYENVKFDQPVGQSWMRINVIDGKTHRQNIGNFTQFRTHGVVNFQIQTPASTGTASMRAIKDALEKVFIDRQVPMENGYITFCNGEFRPPREIAGWYSRSYQIEFRASWTMSR